MLGKVVLFPYYLTLKIRHAMYDHGWKKSFPCEVPTICVGNIAAGGTGKTPHTEMILRALLQSDDWAYKNIAVLSRGHKRKSRGFQQVTKGGSASFFGDEPLQIKNKFPSVTVAVDRPREEGCDFLVHPEKLQSGKRRVRKCKDKDLPASDIIVLDDAFQYRRLRCWFNIILVDWNRPVSKDSLLPFGRLRDIPERLHYADIIIVTKCPAYMEDDERVAWVKTLGINDFDPETCQGTDKKGKKITILFTCINYCQLKPVFPEEADPRYVYSKKLVLFSGIAKDTPLRRYLSDTYKIIRHFKFADHHKYTRGDIRRIALASSLSPTAVVATTEKDSQRLVDNNRIPGKLKDRLFYVPIEVAFLSDHEKEVFESVLIHSLRYFYNSQLRESE